MRSSFALERELGWEVLPLCSTKSAERIAIDRGAELTEKGLSL